MAKRCIDWDQESAKYYRNTKFVREFLLAAMEEGIPLQKALKKVISAYGIVEFAAKINMASPNLLRAIDLRHNPTQETLNRLLNPFGLTLGIQPLKRVKAA